MKDDKLIDSVLGFNLNTELQVPQQDGTCKILTGGIKSSVFPEDTEGRVEIGKNVSNVNKFTIFNQALFEKIKDYQKENV
jgi:hypothetical protein